MIGSIVIIIIVKVLAGPENFDHSNCRKLQLQDITEMTVFSKTALNVW